MRFIRPAIGLTLLMCFSFFFTNYSEAAEYNKYNHSQMTERFVWSNGQLYKLTYHYDGNGNLINKTQVQIDSNIYSPAEISYSNGSFNIIVAGIDPAVGQVSFPTWTDSNGQDDIFWYPGENLGNGMWKVTIQFSRHHNELGKYITHIYAGSSLQAVRETIVTGTTNLRIPAEVNLAEGSYDVFIDGVGAEATAVRFPTWTHANGQDDLIWYEGYRVSEGTWKATIPFKDHQHEKGTYITHVYSYDQYGNAMGIGVGTTTAIQGVKALPEVSFSNASYSVIAAGVDTDVTQVIFPTWTTQNGQDDLVWYEGEQVDLGVWRAIIPFSKHSNERGDYITHVYDKTHNAFLGGTSTLVKETTSVRIAPQVSLVDGSYDIFVDGVGDQVSSVKFPTWTILNGQDDIEWKEGYKLADHTWMVNIRFSDHNQETGPYTTHIYSYDPYGNGVMIGAGYTTVGAGVKAPSEANYYAGSYEIIAYGIDPTATQVQFPTWTDHNGQDDIIWYDGEKVDQGVWKIRIYYNKHNNETGSYITHIYVNGVFWDANASIVKR